MSKGQKATTEIQAKVKELFSEIESEVISSEFFQSEMKDEFNEWDSAEIYETIKLFKEKQVSFEHVDNHGGEGEGEDYWSVYKFTDDNTKEVAHVKFQGWYQSYNGSEFSEWFFVEPKERMVTFYE